MITIPNGKKQGVMGELRNHSKFLFLVLFAVIFLLMLYSLPMDFQLNSRLVFSHVRYLSSESSKTSLKVMTREMTTRKPQPKYDCSSRRRRWYADDLLCQEPPKFLPNFKNPCFYDKSGDKQYLRCLPYFHIFGVCKTGTTDLFQRLMKHPQVIPNRGILKKETWYWTWRRYGKSGFKVFSERDRRKNLMLFRTYLGLFDSNGISEMKVSNQDRSLYSDVITGSADPMDFWDQTQWKLIPQNNISWSEPKYTAPNLLRHVIPSLKLIVMLRDPIERMYSHYYHGGFGINPQSFHKDVISALRTIERCRQNYTLRSCLYNQSVMNQLKVPIYASIYHVHMKTWMDVFPRNQIHIIRTEDFSKDISGHMTNLFKFLNISDVSQKLLRNITMTRHAYETQRKKSAGPMLPETWEILKAFFDVENKELVKLLNNTKFNWDDVYLNRGKSITVNKDFKNNENSNTYYTNHNKTVVNQGNLTSHVKSSPDVSTLSSTKMTSSNVNVIHSATSSDFSNSNNIQVTYKT